MKEEKLDIERLAEITAYHEAAHFVFALLMNKFDNSFEKPSKATIKVIMGEQFSDNFIAVSLPGCDKEILVNDKMKKKHVFGSCFVLLAGYTSTKVFYDKGYEFINKMIPGVVTPESGVSLTEDTKLKFTSLNDNLIELNLNSEHGINKNHDITKIVCLLDGNDIIKDKNILNNDIFERDIAIRIIDFIVEKLCLLMNEEPVKESIELVKDELLKNNGEAIKNGALDTLIEKVEPLIANVNVSQYLDACIDAWENDNWKIESSGGGIDFV